MKKKCTLSDHNLITMTLKTKEERRHFQENIDKWEESTYYRTDENSLKLYIDQPWITENIKMLIKERNYNNKKKRNAKNTEEQNLYD